LSEVGFRIEWLDEPELFARLAADWDEMLPGDARPFDSHAWFAAWYRAFGGDAGMRVCLAWDGGQLKAALPLVARRGRSMAAMANLHSPVFRPVGRRDDAVRAVVEAALAKGTGNVELPALPAEDPAVRILGAAATGAGRRHVIARQHVSPIVDTTGDYEDWRASSKPHWGAPLERFRRKMARDHDVELSIVEPAQDL
jgi:hypothetical protein